jgi:ribulose-5-phosphate 4-epimerase/fuculose-1-phosphate aldolase
MRNAVQEYMDSYGMRPKAVLMQNHGLVALGGTAREVESITAMWDKAAKVLMGTFKFGGPRYMSNSEVDRIAQRPDEEQRKRLIEGHV